VLANESCYQLYCGRSADGHAYALIRTGVPSSILGADLRGAVIHGTDLVVPRSCAWHPSIESLWIPSLYAAVGPPPWFWWCCRTTWSPTRAW
jgi:hypothetical protein